MNVSAGLETIYKKACLTWTL